MPTISRKARDSEDGPGQTDPPEDGARLLRALTDDRGSAPGRATIAAAHSGDVIVFDSSLSGKTITLTRGELAIDKSLDIEGLGAIRLTVSGNDASRVFDIVNAKAKVTIAGLTIAHGFAVQGAGIDNLGKLTVSNCVLIDNAAAGGPGQDAVGGGLFNEPGGKLTMSYTTFTHNQAIGGDGGGGPGGYGRGGGFENQGTASVDHGTFTDNLAQGGAGTSNGVGFEGFGLGGASTTSAAAPFTITA